MDKCMQIGAYALFVAIVPSPEWGSQCWEAGGAARYQRSAQRAPRECQGGR
jgi:hypothetical protein